MITEEELMSQIREQGLEDVGQVKEAYMESDGQISIVEQPQRKQTKANRKEK